jgi:hypothetical protein
MQVINSIYNKNKIITTLDNNIKDIEGKKIDKIIYHNNSSYLISSYLNETSIINENNKIYVYSTKDNEVKYKKMSNLSLDDFICFERNNNDIIDNYNELNLNFLYFYGLSKNLITEVNNRFKIKRIYLDSNKLSNNQDIVYSQLLEADSSIKLQKEFGQYFIESDEFNEKLKSLKIKNYKDKLIPDIIFNLPKDKLKEFLSGYFDYNINFETSDSSNIKISSHNIPLLNQIKELLKVFSIYSVLNELKVNDNKTNKLYTRGFLSLSSKETLKFHNNIGFKSKYKINKINDIKDYSIIPNGYNILKNYLDKYDQNKNIKYFDRKYIYSKSKENKKYCNRTLFNSVINQLIKNNIFFTKEELLLNNTLLNENYEFNPILEIKKLIDYYYYYPTFITKQSTYHINNMLLISI